MEYVVVMSTKKKKFVMTSKIFSQNPQHFTNTILAH